MWSDFKSGHTYNTFSATLVEFGRQIKSIYDIAVKESHEQLNKDYDPNIMKRYFFKFYHTLARYDR